MFATPQWGASSLGSGPALTAVPLAAKTPQPLMLEQLERMLASGKDTALLRFSIGSEHLKRGDPAAAAAHLRKAVDLDPKYSAAWKLLGKANEAAGAANAAADAWTQGIAVAEANGDIQAVREMRVFLKRLARTGG